MTDSKKDVILASVVIPAGTLGPNDPLPPLTVMLGSLPYESAVQQEMNDMARENQALKERIAELESRVETAREEMLLIEWRDAREAIFKAASPSPDEFKRLGSAELALMTYARSLSSLSVKDKP